MSLPLSGLRVLDLTRLLPGPLCTLWLADLGAEIIKIEAPEGGDYARWYPPIRQRMSGIFAALNRNKRSIAMDLKHPQAVEAFLRLVPQVDILVESFRPGVMERMGLGYEQLRVLNPRLVYCAITGYGQDGPLAQRAGHDLNYLARAGLLDVQRKADGSLPMPGVQIGDIAGGSLVGVTSILAALYQRERTGEGSFCDVSMSESLLSFLVMELGQRAAGLVQEPAENFLRGGVPCYGVYACQDGRYLSVGALEPKFWATLVQVLGLPELLHEALEQGEAGQRVRDALTEAFSKKTRDEWVAIFAQHDACVEPVLAVDELAQDPQWQARQALLSHEHPSEGDFVLPRSPIRLRGAEEPSLLPAPSLGQDGTVVLQELGFSSEEIEALSLSGALLLPE
ncbi:MAG: CoA transferase [Myxococcales bacterium]|nr:CoA transferase [Myxococcales bacterium]